MSVIRLVTEVPGPKSKALQTRRKAAVMNGIATGMPMFVASGKGAQVTDVDGNTFLDFASGIGVLAVGHSHPKVAAAIAEQAKAMTHMAFQVAAYESYVAVCERVAKLSPIPGDKKTLLVSTGAEAVENAVKIARVATGRQAVIAFNHAFHGRTLLGMTLTGKVQPYKVGGAFAPEVYRLPFPYAYRGEGNVAFEGLLKNIVAPEAVAAVILEPVLGEGGFIPAPVEFLKNLRAFCDKNGIVLIADEIQTGFGRTGAMFASQVLGLEPDLMTFAKSVAGGMPLAGVVGKSVIVDKALPGALGGTYAGNPLACAAALATMDVIESEKLVERASVLGNTMRARFEQWASKSPHLGDIRGLGAMLAIELVKDKATREPAPELATRVKERCLAKGLIILGAGTYANCIRILVPLVISEAELDEGLTILENALLDG
ncbi:MAG TPA: 4-aminobutyrate--2-oxoglutarate transaminase [Myxococcota bacterium]|nr:4-aminobutyrate--2-oxoglutarate transaminase [Myxococcota bacterium]